MSRDESATKPFAAASQFSEAGPATSVGRCVTVWVAISAAAAAGTGLGVDAAADSLHSLTAPSTIDVALVTAAGLGATLLCPWLWLIATLSVLDALRGRVATGAGWTRRLTLLACGVAATTSVVSPAHAATSGTEGLRGDGGSSSLSGLPYPDRVSSKQDAGHQPTTPPPLQVSTPSAAAGPDGSAEHPDGVTDREPDRTGTGTGIGTGPGRYRVRAGDTLWAIAGTATTITDSTDLPGAVKELHRRNRRVIGDDPDLIRPGQVLDLNSEGDEPR